MRSHGPEGGGRRGATTLLLPTLLLPTLLLLLPGPALAEPAAASSAARVQYLEAEQKALRYRLEGLEAAAAEDQRMRELERDMLEQIALFEQTGLSGKGDFLVLDRAYFGALLDSLLPLAWEAEGFRFQFTRSELKLEPAGIFASLHYEVSGPELKQAEDELPPAGRLRCRFEITQSAGVLSLHLLPLDLQVDDRSYKAARLLQTRFPATRFAGLLPVLPVPVALPGELSWQGRKQAIEAKLDPARRIILPDQVLLPFELKIVGAPQQASQPLPAPAASAPVPAKIPVGLTPDTLKQ